MKSKVRELVTVIVICALLAVYFVKVYQVICRMVAKYKPKSPAATSTAATALAQLVDELKELEAEAGKADKAKSWNRPSRRPCRSEETTELASNGYTH